MNLYLCHEENSFIAPIWWQPNDVANALLVVVWNLVARSDLIFGNHVRGEGAPFIGQVEL